MPVPTSPISSSFRHFTCRRATDFPTFAWDALRRHEVNANVILPILLKCLKQEHAGIPVRDHLWVVVYTQISESYDVKLILSCTDGLTGKYPVFLFTPTPYPSIYNDPDTYPVLHVAAVQLCQALPSQLHRVYSVFGPEILCRTFVTLWSHHVGVDIDQVPYYEAKISYLTSETFVDEKSRLYQLSTPGEMRSAERKDLNGVADLCFRFATKPFTLTSEGAFAEARKLIENGLVWVHTSGSGDDPERIVCIVAFTRNSERVATITKVFTNPDCRGVGYAERLVRRVCEHLLHNLQKDKVALFVGHDNPAANVYGRVGFLGIGKGALPAEGVDPWVEFGFDQKYVELGQW